MIPLILEIGVSGAFLGLEIVLFLHLGVAIQIYPVC